MVDEVRPVGVELTATNEQYDAAMAASTSQTRALADGVDALTQKISALSSGAGRKLQIIAAADIALMTAGAAAAGSLESQLEGLAAQSQALATNQKAGERTFDSYTASVNRLRKEFPMATGEAKDLIGVVSRFSSSSRDVDKMADSFTKLSGATGESSAGLAQGLLQLNRQMGNGIQDIDRYSNTVLKLSASSNTSASSLMNFAGVLAPAGRQLKISETDILGISAAFSRAGQDGNIAANAFNKMANDIGLAMQTNSPLLRDYAALVGMTTDQLKTSDKTDVITQIFENLNRQGPDAIRTLQRLGFEGQRNLRSIQAVAQQQGGIGGAVRDARLGFANEGRNNELERAQRAAFDGLMDQTRKLSESGKRNAEAFGAPFATVATEFVQAMTMMSNASASLMEGPLGTLAQWAARIVAPLALVAGTLLTMAGPLATMAGIRMFAGAGVGGLLGGMGRSGRLARGSEDAYYQGRMGPVRRTMFEAGQGAGMWLGGLRDRMDDRRFGNEDPEERARRRAEGRGLASRAAGVPFRAAGLGLNLAAGLYDPLQYRPGNQGAFDPSQRGGIPPGFMGRMGNRARYGWDMMLAAGAGDDPETRRGQMGLQARERLQRFRGMDDAAEKTSKSLRTLGDDVRSTSGGFRRLMTNLGGAAMGAGAIAAPYAGRAIGGIAGFAAANPFMLGILGVTAGSAIYNAQKDQHADPGAYRSALAPYAERAGLSMANPASSLFGSRSARLQRESQATTMRGALAFTDPARELASMPGREFVNRQVAKGKNKEELLQRLAPAYAGMDANPAMMSDLRTDLLQWSMQTTGSDADARWILDRLQSPTQEGQAYFGNRAGEVAFDPGAVISAAGSRRAGLRDVFGLAAERRSAVTGRSGNAAGRAAAAADANRLFGTVFGRGGMWRDTGSALDRNILLGGGIGGGQEDFKKELEKTFGASLDMGKSPFADIMSTDIGGDAAPMTTAKFFEQVARSVAGGDSKAGTLFTSMGLRTPKKGMEEDDLEALISGNTAKLRARGFMTAGESDTQQAKNLEMTKKFYKNTNEAMKVADEMFGNRTEGIFPDANVRKFKDNTENVRKQFEATVEGFAELSRRGGARGAMVEAERRAAAADAAGQTDVGDFYRSVQGYAMNQVQLNRGAMSPIGQMTATQGDVTRLLRLPDNMKDDPNYQAQLDAAITARDAARQQAEQILRQTAIQMREFNIQQQEAEYQFSIQRARSYQDFHIMRQRAEADFQRQRSRAIHDFNLQQKYAQQDFATSRRRQEEDFQHQVVLMTERTAKQVYNIYERVNVQRTTSSMNLLMNGEDQLRRIQEQTANLDKIRAQGLSDDAIQQLGLGEAGNAQQLQRLVGEFSDNPELVRDFNKQIAARLKAAKKLVTDESSTEWEEMVRSYKLGRERAQEDFDKQMARSRKQFQLALSRQRQDFRRSMNEQADDFHRSMARMQADFRHSQEVARKAMERSIEDMNKNTSELIKEGGDALGKNARQALNKLNKFLSDSKKPIHNTFNDIRKQFEAFFGKDSFGNLLKLLPFAGGQLLSGPNDPRQSMGGPAMGGGGGHTHSPTCGHGQGMGGDTNAATMFTGNPAGAGMGGYGGIDWRRPIRAPQTSGYGWRRDPFTGASRFHNGIDFGAPTGTPYFAPADGTVSSVQSTGWGGRVPFINHGNGIQTFYGHSSSVAVRAGQRVRQGQIVGRVGNVGRSTGPHLHFGASRNGRNINPAALLSGAGIGPAGPGGAFGIPAIPIIELLKRYPDIEEALEQFKDYSAYGLKKNHMSGMINTMAKRYGNKHHPSAVFQMGGPDNLYGDGAIFTGHQTVGVGDRGPELALPLNAKGAAFLQELMQKLDVGPLSNARGGQQIINNVVHNTKIDKSTTFTGPITVQSNDPNAFIRALQAKQRQDALLNPQLAGVHG